MDLHDDLRVWRVAQKRLADEAVSAREDDRIFKPSRRVHALAEQANAIQRGRVTPVQLEHRFVDGDERVMLYTATDTQIPMSQEMSGTGGVLDMYGWKRGQGSDQIERDIAVQAGISRKYKQVFAKQPPIQPYMGELIEPPEPFVPDERLDKGGQPPNAPVPPPGGGQPPSAPIPQGDSTGLTGIAQRVGAMDEAAQQADADRAAAREDGGAGNGGNFVEGAEYERLRRIRETRDRIKEDFMRRLSERNPRETGESAEQYIERLTYIAEDEGGLQRALDDEASARLGRMYGRPEAAQAVEMPGLVPEDNGGGPVEDDEEAQDNDEEFNQQFDEENPPGLPVMPSAARGPRLDPAALIAERQRQVGGYHVYTRVAAPPVPGGPGDIPPWARARARQLAREFPDRFAADGVAADASYIPRPAPEAARPSGRVVAGADTDALNEGGSGSNVAAAAVMPITPSIEEAPGLAPVFPMRQRPGESALNFLKRMQERYAQREGESENDYIMRMRQLRRTDADADNVGYDNAAPSNVPSNVPAEARAEAQTNAREAEEQGIDRVNAQASRFPKPPIDPYDLSWEAFQNEKAVKALGRSAALEAAQIKMARDKSRADAVEEEARVRQRKTAAAAQARIQAELQAQEERDLAAERDQEAALASMLKRADVARRRAAVPMVGVPSGGLEEPAPARPAPVYQPPVDPRLVQPSLLSRLYNYVAPRVPVAPAPPAVPARAVAPLPPAPTRAAAPRVPAAAFDPYARRPGENIIDYNIRYNDMIAAQADEEGADYEYGGPRRAVAAADAGAPIDLTGDEPVVIDLTNEPVAPGAPARRRVDKGARLRKEAASNAAAAAAGQGAADADIREIRAPPQFQAGADRGAAVGPAENIIRIDMLYERFTGQGPPSQNVYEGRPALFNAEGEPTGALKKWFSNHRHATGGVSKADSARWNKMKDDIDDERRLLGFAGSMHGGGMPQNAQTQDAQMSGGKRERSKSPQPSPGSSTEQPPSAKAPRVRAARFVKGSPEAKAYMAALRAKRQKKGGPTP